MENYRALVSLSHTSKFFERIIYKKINIMHNKLLTRFRQSHATQHSLITMLEKWKSTTDKGRIFVLYLWISQRPSAQ